MERFDFSGYATRNDLLCGDGRTIRKNAFKDNDGDIVPLIWNHDHTNSDAVLGHALLENRADGVYAYCKFNNTEQGQNAKELVKHGDVRSMSIYANKLKQIGNDVIHGSIKELSLVLAGANPGAYIDYVMAHGEDGEAGLIANYDEEHLVIYHSDEDELDEEYDEDVEDEEIDEEEDETMYNEYDEEFMHADSDRTLGEILETLDEDQETAVNYLIGMALESAGNDDDDDEEDDADMKHNIFDQEDIKQGNYLSHSDEEAIISMAKQSNVGSLKQAIQIYAEEAGVLQHSEDGVGVFEDYGVLFPELELLKKGEPETLYKYDQSWIGPALAKIHKSPFSRIRTRHADARLAELKAKGYQNKGDQKTIMGQIAMINRETTPQTIYIKDNLHRDDIVDITDFSIVDYQWKMMRGVLNETIVLAAMVGDGRELDDPDKIKEENIRPIWTDNEEYTIHYDVDVAAAKNELQGTDTAAHFGDNYIYAEAVITAALYSREKFKGTGTPDFYCTPHLVNVMLLARDLNGRRIYDSKADLAKALNCNSIVEVEHFEGLVRTTEEGEKKALLGMFVNLNDYTFGSTRGGEITKFEDFDMDFNLKKFMLETRLSGSLYKLKSAIVLEEPVVDAVG